MVAYRDDPQQITAGYHTTLPAVPWASHGSQDVLVASPSASCQTGVQVSKAKRAMFWNAGYVLSVCWTFIYFLTLQQETALLSFPLPPITGCLLLPGVNIFSTLSFLPSTVTGERGTDLRWWQSLCAFTSLQNGEMMLLFFAIFCHVVLNCHSMLRKKQTRRNFPFCHPWVVILQCKSLNLFPSRWEKECTGKPGWCVLSTNKGRYTV